MRWDIRYWNLGMIEIAIETLTLHLIVRSFLISQRLSWPFTTVKWVQSATQSEMPASLSSLWASELHLCKYAPIGEVS